MNHLVRILFCLIMLAPMGRVAAIPQRIDLTGEVLSIQQANAWLEEGHAAFLRGDFKSAQEIYVKVAQSGFGTAQVWFNAGAAAYRAQDNGHAVLFFRRALKLDPTYDRALKSLDFVSPETNKLSQGFLSEIAEALFVRTSPILWVIGAQICFLVVCLGVFLALRTADRERRGHWVAVLSWSLLLCVLFGGMAGANHYYRVGGDEAVIVEDKVIVRAGPADSSTAELELPAGTVVDLVEDPRHGFVRVKLADGRAGYVSTANIERI